MAPGTTSDPPQFHQIIKRIQVVFWIRVPFVRGHIGLLKIGRDPDCLNFSHKGRLMVEVFLKGLATRRGDDLALQAPHLRV